MSRSRTAGPAAREALSGPHVCSHVGTRLMTIAKAALADACRSNGGSITAPEIETILDLVASTPEVFSIYTGQYAACADIHHNGKFTQIDAPTFARFILQSFCQDMVRENFRGQIERAGPVWTRHFLEGAIAHIETHALPGFRDRLYARYRALALENGRGLDASALRGDAEIRTALRQAFEAIFAEADEHEAFTDAVNAAIGKAMHLTGPSPLKVTNADITAFLNGLCRNMAHSRFRRAVLVATETNAAQAT